MSEDSGNNQQVRSLSNQIKVLFFLIKVSVSDIDVDFLPIIHEIVKTIEKDPQVNKTTIILFD